MNTRLIRLTAAVAIVLAAAGFALWRFAFLALPVEIVELRSGAVEFVVSGPGTVQARIPVVLSARTTASIAALHADQGMVVKRGQLLALLDDRDLAARYAAASVAGETVGRNIRAAEALLAKARADLDLARGNYQRDLDVYRAGYISRAAIDTAEAGLRSAEASMENAGALLEARRSEARGAAQDARYAAAVLSFTRIHAPMDGVITQRAAEVGSTVVPGTPIFRMVDPATLWVAVRVDESVVGRVRVGMPASIRLRTGEAHPGKVARIAQQSDAATRELEVNVGFDSPLARFAIDQEAQVAIRAGEETGLVAPATALVQIQGRQGVLVVRDGRARFQPVETGAADSGRVIIRKGLAAGEAVLATPQEAKPGARVQAVRAPS